MSLSPGLLLSGAGHTDGTIVTNPLSSSSLSPRAPPEPGPAQALPADLVRGLQRHNFDLFTGHSSFWGSSPLDGVLTGYLSDVL